MLNPSTLSVAERQALVKRAVDLSQDLFLNAGYNCAESSLRAVTAVLEIPLPDEVKRLSTPFGGGIGSTHRSICGALSGGVMALGLVYGRVDADAEQRKVAAAHVETLFKRFTDRFSTELCGPLNTLPMGDPGRREFCGKYVAVVTEWAAQDLLGLA